MKRYFLKSPFLFISNIIVIIIFSFFNVSLAFVLKSVVDTGTTGDLNRFYKVILLTLLFFLGTNILYYTRKFLMGLLIKNTMLSLKSDIFKGIIYRDMASFNGENSAKYISTLTNDVNMIETDYFTVVIENFEFVVMFIMAVYGIFSLNLIIAVSVLIVGIIPLLIPQLFQKILGLKKKIYSDSLGIFTSKVKDIFSGFEVIKGFNIEGKVLSEFENSNKKVEEAKFSSVRFNAMVETISEVFGMMIFLVAMGLGTYLTIKGSFTIGSMIASVQLMNNIVNPILCVSFRLNKIKGVKTVISKVEDIMKEQKSENKGITKEQFNNYVEFENVSFSYNEDRNILKDINLKIKKGEKIAFVGRSGSGKSTLLKILLRYYDNYNGKILLDGTEIRDISIEDTYNLMSVIHQNIFIFDDSIKENISLYKDYSENEIQSAIKNSGLLSLIEKMPKGKESPTGENGCNLSGGEKQRIAIARALIKKTPILIVDEATASLDSKTSYEIEGSILDINDLTALIITHRLNPELLKRYDRIVLIDDGSIIEEGSFNKLMDKRGLFYSLYSIENKIAA